MKTIRFQLLLLALFVMVGCQKDEMSTSMKKGSYSLVASIESNDSTSRTAVDENGGVTWVATDAIGVFGTQTKNAKFESTGVGANVTFVGDLESSHEEPTLAYYPYDENASLDGNALSFTLPSEYSYTGQCYAPMLGIKQADGNFVFKHLVGLLKVTIEDIPQNATKFVITSKGNEPLPISGIAKVEDVTVDNAVLELQALPDSYSVTYNFSPTVFSSDKIFYIPLPVGTYERLVVSLIGNEDDIIFERSISNLKVERKAMIEMPVVGCEEGISYTLSDDVFPIYKSDENYITSVESNKITYKSNIPADRRPQVGQILLFSDVTGMFPTGFWGRVKSISEVNDGFIVETETATIEDTFENLKLNRTIDVFEGDDGIELGLVSTESMNSRGGTSIDEIISIPFNGQYKRGTDEFSFFVNFQGDVRAIFQIKLDILIENKCIYNFDVDIKGGLGLTFDKLSLGIETGAEMNPLSEAIKEFRKTSLPIVIPPLVVVPNFIVGIYSNVNAQAEVVLPLQLNIEFDANIPLIIQGSPTILIPDRIGFGWDKEEFSVNLNGMIGVGPGTGLGLVFYGLIPVEFIVSPKYAIQGEMELYPKRSYNTLKNTKVKTGFVGDLTASIGLGFSNQLKESISISTGDYYMISENYVLPTISNLKYENDNGSITYNVINTALFKHKHSLGIYDADNNCIEFIDYSSDYINDSQGKLSYILKEIERGKKYKAKTIIKTEAWGGLAWYADSLEFVVPENIQVTTGEATDISYHVASFDAAIKGMNFESDFEYGIFCSLENEPTADNSVKVEVGKIEDGKFTSSTNQLKEGERYSYRAYVYKNGEYHYGEIKDFVTMAMNVKSLSYSNLTNNSVTLAGTIEGLNNLDQYEYGICYSTGISPSKDYGTLVKGVNIQNGSFSVNVSGLTENTTYYWCAYAIKDGKYYYGTIKSFKTNAVSEPAAERDILIAFYNATDGDNWKNNENWCSDKPLREWFGITTDGDGYVTEINLNGSMEASIGAESVKFGLKGNANLSNLSKLEDLYLSHNELTSLTVENCPNLYRLQCRYNALTEVNVDGAEYLSLDYNQLSSLDFSHAGKYSKLISLNVQNNQLFTIDVSGCLNMEDLCAFDNMLTSLDVSNNKKIRMLYCYRNQLSYLNIDGCNDLENLQMNNNLLESIDLTDKVQLKRLTCYYNKLKNIKIDPSTKLTSLNLHSNEFEELDISEFKNIKSLNCSNNKMLNKLKLHNEITSLECSNTNLTELDFSGYVNLEKFISNDNNIQKLNFEGCSKLAYIQLLQNNIPVEYLNLIGCTSFGKNGILLYDILFKDIYLPASLGKCQNSFKIWGDWIESEGRYQYPNFHWQ